jgi:hypothetical protein
MKCDQLTRAKYVPVMGTIIRRRNEDLNAIDSSAVSHRSSACLTGLPSFDAGFLPFRSVSSNTWRAIPSPHVKYARGCTNGFRRYRTKKREGFCWARTTSLRLYGGGVQGDVPRGPTANEYGQTGLKWPEEDKCCE